MQKRLCTSNVCSENPNFTSNYIKSRLLRVISLIAILVAADSTSTAYAASIVWNTNNVAGSPGQYTLGTFIADHTIQNFDMSSDGSTQINALHLRDTTFNIAAMSPSPGSTLTASPGSVIITLSGPIDPATVNALTVQLIRAGPDGVFGTSDDVQVSPISAAVINQIKLDFTGIVLPSDKYQISLFSPGNGASGGLAAYWSFDEPSGAAISDSSGNSIVGTLMGGATRTNGVSNGAIDFDGTGLISFGDTLNDLQVPFSISLWVYRRGNETENIISSDDTSSYFGIWMHINSDNSLEVNYGDGLGAQSPNRRTREVRQSFSRRLGHILPQWYAGHQTCRYISTAWMQAALTAEVAEIYSTPMRLCS